MPRCQKYLLYSENLLLLCGRGPILRERKSFKRFANEKVHGPLGQNPKINMVYFGFLPKLSVSLGHPHAQPGVLKRIEASRLKAPCPKSRIA